MQKSHQANAPRQKIMNGQLNDKDRRAAHNKGYTTMRGSVLRMTVLWWVEHVCFVLKFSGNNPAVRVAPKSCLYFLTDPNTTNIMADTFSFISNSRYIKRK